jgi:hypothetical protein
MYSAYVLDETSREKLIKDYPPKYSSVVCHHITAEFGIKVDSPLPKESHNIKVIGYLDDGKGIELFLVSVDGTMDRPDGKVYHITHSLDRSLGYTPADSNKVIEKDNSVTKVDIAINATPKLL